MTKQEVINYCERGVAIGEDDDSRYHNEVLDFIIEVLKQEPILDKVRAEIEHVIDYTYDSTDYDKALYNRAYKDGLYEALDIIDKYKAGEEYEDN